MSSLLSFIVNSDTEAQNLKSGKQVDSESQSISSRDDIITNQNLTSEFQKNCLNFDFILAQNMLYKVEDDDCLDFDYLVKNRKLSKNKIPLIQKKIVKIPTQLHRQVILKGPNYQADIPLKQNVDKEAIKSKLQTLKKWSSAYSYLNLDQELSKLKSLLGRVIYKDEILFELLSSCNYDRQKLMKIMKEQPSIIKYEAQIRHDIEKNFS